MSSDPFNFRDDAAKNNNFPMPNSPQRLGGRKKMPLAPGHSPMDWHQLKQSSNLSGVDQISRYTIQDLQLHNKKDDCWLAFQGKIFNVTPYLPFHPGGKGMLMSGAGKDATALILKYHSWVNIAVILDKCFVGYLVNEK